MGGDDSQKLLPWRGSYSSPGRSEPPANQHSSSKNICFARRGNSVRYSVSRSSGTEDHAVRFLYSLYI
jgi:hypothetical protein